MLSYKLQVKKNATQCNQLKERISTKQPLTASHLSMSQITQLWYPPASRNLTLSLDRSNRAITLYSGHIIPQDRTKNLYHQCKFIPTSYQLPEASILTLDIPWVMLILELKHEIWGEEQKGMGAGRKDDHYQWKLNLQLMKKVISSITHWI